MGPHLETWLQKMRMAAKVLRERESFDLPLIVQNLKAGAGRGEPVAGTMGNMLMTARRNRLDAMGENGVGRELFDEYKAWRQKGNV